MGRKAQGGEFCKRLAGGDSGGGGGSGDLSPGKGSSHLSAATMSKLLRNLDLPFS